jgi:hypothetical protein
MAHWGTNMNERSRVVFAGVLGGLIGAAFGYLYMTEEGRRLRRRIEPGLDDALSEINRLRGTIHKAQTAAREGWLTLNELTGEGTHPASWREAPPARSPF